MPFAQYTTPLKIVQLTDPHLLANPFGLLKGYETDASLRECIHLSASLAPDLFVLTGDISQDGSEASYQRIKHYLDGTGIPYAVLPGNHDHEKTLINIFKTKAYLDKMLHIKEALAKFLKRVDLLI